MISIILYGRNDSYGYNLHKRVAISINCMAEVLTDPDDEILFVDYNTPNDFPTMLEAIQDTLTAKAKSLVKIIRVRPEDHRPFSSLTHLVALEPTARNAALRRSNPQNRWILSTNTDMIFVPRSGKSLSEIASNLPDGHYGIPRFELPETLWESMDRSDPKQTISDVGVVGWKYNLNEAVLSAKPHMFDAPGDFQLMLRKDLFDINGFDESMLLGWHVDSNIAKRIGVTRGNVGDLSESVFGYHCDHTRQVTPMHRKSAPSNDLVKFVDAVTDADLPNQRHTWGFVNNDLEIIILSRAVHASYENALKNMEISPQTRLTYSSYTTESFNDFEIQAEHRIPFLLDLVASIDKKTTFYWFGDLDRNYEMFSRGIEELGIKSPVTTFDLHGTLNAEILNGMFAAPGNAGAYFVFNFLGQESNLSKIAKAFSQVVEYEIVRDLAKESPSRFIGLGVTHTHFEQMWESKIESSKTPFSIGFKHGFVELGLRQSIINITGKRQKRSLLIGTMPGNAGIVNQAGAIEASAGVPGCLSYGPFIWPKPGKYKIKIKLKRLKRTKSNLNLTAINNIAKRVKGRGDNFFKLLPVAAGLAFLLGRITFSSFGTMYVEVFSNNKSSKKSFLIPQFARKMTKSLTIEIGTEDRNNDDFKGLDIRIMTSGHYLCEIESISLSAKKLF